MSVGVLICLLILIFQTVVSVLVDPEGFDCNCRLEDRYFTAEIRGNIVNKLLLNLKFGFVIHGHKIVRQNALNSKLCTFISLMIYY